MQKLIESLSPLERKILPYVHLSVERIGKTTGLDAVSVQRALKFLENKKIVGLSQKKEEEIEFGINGLNYKKTQLPERALLHALLESSIQPLGEIKEASGLSDNEFKAALGALKKKNMIDVQNGKMYLKASKEEAIRKFPEELFLESLPRQKASLSAEEKTLVEYLKTRKDMIEVKETTTLTITLTALGKELQKQKIDIDLVEEVTPELIKSGQKKIRFRRYDVQAGVPRITGGKEHISTQAVNYVRKIWTDLGFSELTGPMTDSSFWIFDALFTAQDHPVREMQDTFFIKDTEAALPDAKIVAAVKQAHERGVSGSKGWNYDWQEKVAQKLALRTHTTSLTARALASLDTKKLPVKLYAIGKAFRNETIDWSHGIEFYQTEGIVIDKNANLRYLLGYLQEFYRKMGYKKMRFRPSFFSYTEPSVEIDVYHEERKEWLELGGAGMLRPEVTVPLLGQDIPVLAWGQGLDRIAMNFFKIKDLREMYANDIAQLREKKIL